MEVGAHVMSTRWAGRRFPLRVVVAGIMLWGLAACQTSPPPAATPVPAPITAQPAVPAPGAQEYQVVGDESLVQILVYRGGAMSRLGHNHVIASHHLAGVVSVTDDLTQTRFDIGIPVNELTIDEPAMREQAGADFPPGVPQSARDGTRKNMLSQALLDGEKYPEIRLRATEVVAAGEGFDMGVEIKIKDQVRNVRVPVTVERTAGALTARGEFPLKQSELGFKPFSIAMGALVVLDEMRIHFEVVARQ
jgi:polyisoprenoid-binding protein YceI